MKLRVSLVNLFRSKTMKNSVQANYVRIYRRTRKDEEYTNYKEAFNAAANEIRQSKRIYEQKFACNIKHGSKSFHAYIRSKHNVRDKVEPPEDRAGYIISQGFF